MELVIELIIIFLLATFQSLFGVGLLLFGTPIFLFAGYDFESTLALLLPISISISFLQIFYQRSSIKSLVLEYNIFCLPFLVLFLVMAIYLQDKLNIRIYDTDFFMSLNRIYCLLWGIHGFKRFSIPKLQRQDGYMKK